MKIQGIKSAAYVLIISLLLAGCTKGEAAAPTAPAAANEGEKIQTYEGDGGWKLTYDTEKFFLNDTLGDGEIGFNYIGECSGTTAIIVSYHPERMPDEILYEKVSGYDDSLIERGEAMFGDYWSHYRKVAPENEDPNAGDVMYEDFTGIEHNKGTVLIDYIRHLETDDAQKREIDNSVTELLSTFELKEHDLQMEYAYIPGQYTREYEEEMEGEKLVFTDTVDLYGDHTCSLTFQDTVTGVWTGTKIILDGGVEYEYTVEGSALLLNMDGEWIQFVKTEFGDEPANEFENRVGKTSFESYDEVIGLLKEDEAYALVKVKGYDGDVLLITPYTYDDLEGHLATIECTAYTMKPNGLCTADSSIFSGGTANPISVDDEGLIYAATHHTLDKLCYGKNGTDTPALMVLKSVYIEEFDDNGGPKKVGGFSREKNSLIDDDSVSLDENDTDFFWQMFADYEKTQVISFTKAR